MKHRRSSLTKFARACATMAVGYALALQILLAGVIAAGMAGAPLQADGAVICYANGGNANDSPQPSHSPASAADCMLACAQGLGNAGILPANDSQFLVPAAGRLAGRDAAASFVVSRQSSPRLAQGPPQIA